MTDYFSPIRFLVVANFPSPHSVQHPGPCAMSLRLFLQDELCSGNSKITITPRSSPSNEKWRPATFQWLPAPPILSLSRTPGPLLSRICSLSPWHGCPCYTMLHRFVDHDHHTLDVAFTGHRHCTRAVAQWFSMRLLYNQSITTYCNPSAIFHQVRRTRDCIQRALLEI